MAWQDLSDQIADEFQAFELDPDYVLELWHAERQARRRTLAREYVRGDRDQRGQYKRERYLRERPARLLAAKRNYASRAEYFRQRAKERYAKNRDRMKVWQREYKRRAQLARKQT